MRLLRRLRGLAPVAWFTAALAMTVLATAGAIDRLPVFEALRPAVLAGERPPDDDHYLANDIGGHVDHHVLYFGLDEVALAGLRAADVLFLGNSRLMFALRPEVLGPAFDTLGLRYYALGFGFREADAFPMAIIRKFDLRPRLVVVNADGFFAGGFSDWAQVVVRDTPFAARKRQWEAEAAHEVRRRAHVVFPHWPSFFGLPGLGQARTFTAYRSRRDGTWAISPWPSPGAVFTPAPDEGPGVGRGEAAAARAALAEFTRRGSGLVLTRVPTPVPMPGAGPAEVARLLRVPLLQVDITAPTSSDHSHLDAPSAHDWSQAFVETLAAYLRNMAPATNERR